MVSKIRKSTEHLSDRAWLIIIFLFCFLSHECINFVMKTLASVPTEMALLSWAEYIAGHDWSELLSNTDYFGVGFYVICYPFVALIKDRYILHQVILAFVCILETIPSILCYKILRKDFNIEDKVYCFIVAIAISFFDVVYTVTALNEHPLKIILWIIVYMVLRIIGTDKKSKKIIYTVIISVLLCYSLTIHSRAILTVMAFVFVVAAYFIIYKKWLVQPVAFILTIAPLYIGSKKLVKYVVSFLWRTSDSSGLRNSDGAAGKTLGMIKYLFQENGIRGFVNTISAQLFSGNVYSFGVLNIMLIVFFIILFLALKYRKDESKHTEINRKVFFVFVFLMTAACITVVADAFYTLLGATILIGRGQGAKFYFFLRYFFYYLSPVLCVLAGMYYYMKDCTLTRKIIKIAERIFELDALYVLISIMPTAWGTNSPKLDALYYMAPFSGRKYGTYMSKFDFYIAVFVIIMAYVIMYHFTKAERKKFYLIVLAAVFAYEYYYVSLVYDYGLAERNYYYIDAYKEKIYNSEEYRDVNNNLYIINNSFLSQITQYEMPDRVVHYGDDYNMSDGVLLVSSKLTWGQVTQHKFRYMYKLDNNEYIYSKEKVYDFMIKIDVMNYHRVYK